MAVQVAMPQLGETVTEGTIIRWSKQVGDTVAEDEVLLEISTDKVDTEIPSPVAGVILDILVPEGETVAVGIPLVVIGEAGEQPEASRDAASSVTVNTPRGVVSAAPAEAADPEPAPPAAAGAAGMRGVLSPVVRKLAAEHEIDLTLITGTGKDGRITRKDVMAAVAAPAREAAAAPAEAASQAQETPQAAPTPATPSATAPADTETVPVGRLRMRIARNMRAARQTAAHVFTSVEVDYEAVARVRQAHGEEFRQREGFPLTYLPFIARAAVDALGTFPVVNSSFDIEAATATYHRAVHLGIAVDLEREGLIVPTIRDCDGLQVRGIARAAKTLADKARTGSLEPNDVSTSTFTITNAGPYGSFISVPIINVPNTAILSTDTVVKRPTVVTDSDGSDAIAVHHVGYLGLSWDHGAFDGSTAAQFLRRIKENLESWDWNRELG